MRRRRFLSTLSLGLVSRPVISVVGARVSTGDWSRYGYDLENTSHLDMDETASSRMSLEWRFEAGERVLSSPAVVDGDLFVGSWGGGMHSISSGSGEERWFFEVEEGLDVRGFPAESGVGSSPTVQDGAVYFGGYDGRVYSVDSDDGTEIWSHNIGALVRASPLVAEGMVVVGDWSGVVHSLDEVTGEEVWRLETSEDKIYSSACYSDGVIYVGTMKGGFSSDEGVEGGGFYAVEIGSGEELWSGEYGAVPSSACVSDGRVYFGSGDGSFYAVDSETGETLWNVESGQPVDGSPAVDESRVYFGGWGGSLYAVDKEAGDVNWVFDAENSFYGNNVSVLGDVVFAGDVGGVVHCIDRESGEKLWEFESEGAVRSTVVSDGRQLYFGCEDGFVYCLRPGGGGRKEDGDVSLEPGVRNKSSDGADDIEGIWETLLRLLGLDEL